MMLQAEFDSRPQGPASGVHRRPVAFQGSGLACRRSQRLVFAGLDFRLPPGGALLLTGPNGSGKSSLLRLMAGLIRPFAGRLGWGDRPVSDDPTQHRASVSYLGHLDALKPVLTVAENLRFWGGGAAREAAISMMALDRLTETPARFLSSGQRRRTALARVIASGAPLWLLDEPTVGLDSASVAGLESALARHLASGGMVAAATHAPIALPGAAALDLADFAPGPSEEEAGAEEPGA
jgi:heme exporter protein A